MAAPVKRDLTDAQRSAVLYRLIAQKWPTDRGAYTVLYEVRNSVGYDGDEGRLDVLVGANWRADGGRRFIGCEVKASRADWLRELRDHRKRVGLEAVCGERWVVAWGGVVKPEELPAGWGLLERRGSVPVRGVGAHRRCECQDRIEEAHRLVGEDRRIARIRARENLLPG